MFADLPFDTQFDQIADVLQALLGDNPSQLDYLFLLKATQCVVDSLREAVVMRPMPSWQQAQEPVQRVSAA